MISRRVILSLALGAGALSVLATGASAQDYKAEWAKTLAAAEKEGIIITLMPPSRSQRAFLSREWPKAFPKIKLSMTTLGGWKFVQRIKTERGAGKYLWDAAMSGSVTGFATRDAGALDPVRDTFIFPDIKDPATWGGWDKSFFDKEKKYVMTTRSFLKMPFFNADLLPPEKIKKMGKAIFLDPSLKGKIIWHDPLVGGSGQSFALVMRRLLGDEGLKKFVTEQVVFDSAMNKVVEKMARSQYAIGFGPVMTRLLARYKKAGVKFDIRPMGNHPDNGAYGNTGGSSLFIIKDRPHPNATKVFVNWYLSKDIQTRLSKAMGENSRRTDVPKVAPADEDRIPGLNYGEPQREEELAAMRDAHAFIRKARGLDIKK